MLVAICKNCLHYDVCKLNQKLPCIKFISKDIFSKSATNPHIKFDFMTILNVEQQEILRKAINNMSDSVAANVAYRHLFFHESFEEIAENIHYCERSVQRFYLAAKNAIIYELIKMSEAKSK